MFEGLSCFEEPQWSKVEPCCNKLGANEIPSAIVLLHPFFGGQFWQPHHAVERSWQEI